MENARAACGQDLNHVPSGRAADHVAQTQALGATRMCAQHLRMPEKGGLSSSDDEEIEVDDTGDDNADVGREAEGSVKDELDELLGLQVQFDETSVLAASPCNHLAMSGTGDNKPLLSMVRPEASSQWGDGCLTKVQIRQCVQQVDIGSDTYKVWSCLRLALGLKSDLQVAAFLLQHYENTKNILLPSSLCRICHQPLSQVCWQCKQPDNTPCTPNPHSPSLHVARSPSPSPPIPQSFSMPPPCHPAAGPEHSPSPPAAAKKKKRRPKGVLVKLKTAEKYNSKGLELSAHRWAERRPGRLKEKGRADNSADVDFLMGGTGGDDGGAGGDDGGEVDNSVEAVDDADKGSLVFEEEEDVKCETTQSPGLESPDRHIQQQPAVTQAGEGEEKLFACKLCPHSYSRACSLRAHMRKHSGEKPFCCSQCPAAFALSGSLIVHLRTHTGDKPYVCEDCGHSFAISSALKQHRRRHTGERPYQCQICPARYSRSDSLKVHMRSHSGDRPFICEECGANFSRLYCLLAHKKKHSGERPYQCSECDATFTQSGKLTIHARKHSGDRPFQCEQCGASFTQSDRLKTHMRIHSGEKPYRCADCGKGFSHPHSLKVHCRAHTGDRPYKCDVCSLTFADPSYFRRHKMKHSASVGSSGVLPARDEELGSCVAQSLPAPVSHGDFSAVVSAANSFSVSLVSSSCVAAPAPSSVISVGYPVVDSLPEVDSLPVVVSTSQQCYSASPAEFCVPTSSTLPSLGFSIPSSVGLGFSLPVPVSVNVVTDTTDTGVSSSDPFTFLPPPLHCPDSYPA